jgi:hypothetical protein
VAGAVQGKIRDLPRFDELRQRPDLARFLPQDELANLLGHKDLAKVSGRELLERHPELVKAIGKNVEKEISKLPSLEDKWGMIGLLGVNRKLEAVDDRIRSPFFPYGLSGIMVAAAAVFFAGDLFAVVLRRLGRDHRHGTLPSDRPRRGGRLGVPPAVVAGG